MRRLTPAVLAISLCSACGTDATPPSRARRPDVHLIPDAIVTRGLVPPDSTLQAVLAQHGLAGDLIQQTIAAVQTVFDPRRLRSRQPFALEQTLDGALRLFEYEIDAVSSLRVRTSEDGDLTAEVVPIPVTVVPQRVSGAIDAATPSLFQSIGAAGEQPELAVALAQVFAGEIDFNTELQPGDHYTVTFERLVRESGRAMYGAITAAEFENGGRVVRAIRFAAPGSPPGYFDEQGRSLRRFFLRTPLKFEPRVTSGFSASRRHPVLHTTRAHRGVDYAAPTGAEVVAIAAGRVLSATSDAVNGRMVRLRHASGYVSQYLHLSAFAPGMRAGAAVAQGQTIGRVGSSGLATGPHLHYGLLRNGVFVNPLLEHRNMPPGDPVPEAAMAAFVLVRDRAIEAFAAGPWPDGDAALASAPPVR